MNKSLYDGDTLTWSPQGKLYQVEYAMETVKQGTCVLGLKSKKHVVLCGLKSTMHESLSYYNDKLYSISNHMGMGTSGLIADAKLLHQYLKNECLNYNYVYESNYPVERIVTKLSESKFLNKNHKEKLSGTEKDPMASVF